MYEVHWGSKNDKTQFDDLIMEATALRLDQEKHMKPGVGL